MGWIEFAASIWAPLTLALQTGEACVNASLPNGARGGTLKGGKAEPDVDMCTALPLPPSSLCAPHPHHHQCFHLSKLEIHVNCSFLADMDVCVPRFHGLELQLLKDCGSSFKCSALKEPVAFRTPECLTRLVNTNVGSRREGALGVEAL